jgi:hypothetical protein
LLFKGTDVSAHDPVSRQLVPLFNPRTEAWIDHFEWQGAVIIGRTNIGRATITLLQINLSDRAEHRRLLMEAGLFPP